MISGNEKSSVFVEPQKVKKERGRKRVWGGGLGEIKAEKIRENPEGVVNIHSHKKRAPTKIPQNIQEEINLLDSIKTDSAVIMGGRGGCGASGPGSAGKPRLQREPDNEMGKQQLLDGGRARLPPR